MSINKIKYATKVEKWVESENMKKDSKLDITICLNKWDIILRKHNNTITTDNPALDRKCWNEFVNYVNTRKLSSGSVEFEGVVLGYTSVWEKNKLAIKKLIDTFDQTGIIPIDKQGRPLMEIDEDSQEQICLAYAFKTGEKYKLQVNLEQRLVLFGNVISKDKPTKIIHEIIMSGRINIGETSEDWFVNSIKDELPPKLSKIKTKVNLVQNRGIYLDKSLDPKEIFLIEETVDQDKIIAQLSKSADSIYFDEMDKYAKDNAYMPFSTTCQIIKVGEPYDNGNCLIHISDTVEELFGEISDPVSLFVDYKTIENIELGTDIVLIGSAYMKNDKPNFKCLSIIHSNTEEEVAVVEKVKEASKMVNLLDKRTNSKFADMDDEPAEEKEEETVLDFDIEE